jgi:RHS repeat-associated protein
MPGRKFAANGLYRYGFNGKEKDPEVKGGGAQYDYGFRIYDPRIGRFLSVDPLTKKYPMLTPYQFASNSPIASIDLDGLEGLVATGMPDPVSGRPTGMVLTVEDASKINRNVTIATFKAVFSEALPKKFIDHYANGQGTPYKLSMQEVTSLNVSKTGIMGITETDQNKFAELTKRVGYRDKGKRHIIHVDNYSIQGAANVGGTLGRFTIELQGKITYDKDDKTKWTFEGKMRYVDKFDFETSPIGEGDLHRSDWGDFQTGFARKFLPGTGFEVTSDWIDVKQTSSDPYFDFYKNKSEESKQNKVSNEIQKSTENGRDNAAPSEIKETKSSG